MVTQNILSIAILILLFMAGLFIYPIIKNWMLSAYYAHRMVKVFKLHSGSYNRLNETLKLLTPPFTLEIAIHQLGKDVNYYLIVPSFRLEEVKNKISGAVEVVDDYGIFYSGGGHIGLIAQKDNWLLSSFQGLVEGLDFSKVNEIGEGVVIQLIFNKDEKDRLLTNFRIAISAPTPYQAQEILMSLKPSFGEFKLSEIKSAGFMAKVVSRQFDEKEAVVWKEL
jgi:hypothetical protein